MTRPGLLFKGAFDPANFGGNLKLWFRSDYGVLNGGVPATNGSNVTVWSDKSGNGHNLGSGAYTGGFPTYKTNGLNGKPTISILGSGKGFTVSLPNYISPPYRFFAVFKCPNGITDSGGIKFWGGAGSDPNDRPSLYDEVTAPKLNLLGGTNGGITAAANIGASNFEQCSFLISSSGVIRSSRINLATGNTGTDRNFSGLSMANTSPDNMTQVCNMEIAEYFLLDRDVTATELAEIENYFTNRYGVV